MILNSKKLLANKWFVLIILTLLVVIVYANSLGNSLVTDDEGLLKEGSKLLTFGRIFQDFSAPLRTIVYSITYLVVGITPWALRLPNILMHLGNCFLIYFIVRKLINYKVAFLTSVLFAVHPLLVEPIVWISGGGYVQYSLFFLLSFWFYLNSTKKLNYYFSIGFFVLMLLSLNRALVLGFAFPLYEVCFAAKTGGLKKNLKKTLPYLILSGLWLVSFLGALGGRATSLDKIYYQDGQFYNPFIQWPLAIASYLTLIFWPGHLTYVHTNNQTTLVYLLRIAITFTYFGVVIWAFMKKRTLAFWLVLFILPLLPSLTPLKIAFIVAERYVYLGVAGILVVVSFYLIKALEVKELKAVTLFLISLAVVGLGVRGMVRNTDWKDGNTLWKKTAEVSGDSSQAHLNNGVKLAKEGDYVNAEKEFIAAIQINPKIAEFYFNLGVLYLKTGHKDKAHENFQKAVELKPGYTDAQKGFELTK